MIGADERIKSQRNAAASLRHKIRLLYQEINRDVMPDLVTELAAAAAMVDGAHRHLENAQGQMQALKERWRTAP